MVEKEVVKDQIVEAARQIFSRFGFRKTTMDEIARGVNKGKSSIYYYFTSKEDIYRAVIEKEAGLVQDEIVRALTNVKEPDEKLKTYIAVRMRAFGNTINFYSAIKDEFLANLDFINKIRERFDNEEIKMVETILKEGVNNDKFVIDNTELAAIALVTAIKGLEAPLMKYHKELNVEERIGHLLKILFFGVMKR
ncbi:MAG: TetR/AcrR family transcriptional regulator [Bacteroidota bacterium]|nr:TetR/AcrR family transcriptional regulator [Bacteroidota bacterium]